MKQPFRIEKKKQFSIVGYCLETTNQKRAGKKAIPEFWKNFKKEGQATLLPLMDQELSGIFGVSVYNTDKSDARKFKYYIGVCSSHADENMLSSVIIPETTWAIFPCTPETIGKTEALAITKWLPRSDYQPLNSGYLFGKMKSEAADIEYYDDHGNAEVWIAVKEKTS